MKRILFSVVFMVLIFTSTSAFADPANTRTYNWTGFYLGMQGSYDVGRSDQDAPLFGTHIDNNLKGVMGGFHIGYNYQTPVNVVVGIETDINAGRITGSSSCPNSSFSCNTDVSSVGSTRFRVGYAINRFLPYIAVGVAYSSAELKVDTVATGQEFTKTRDYYLGWTPSVGFEFAITKNLVARAEYVYYDFFKKQVIFSDGEVVDNKINFQGFKLGLSWKF